MEIIDDKYQTQKLTFIDFVINLFKLLLTLGFRNLYLSSFLTLEYTNNKSFYF